MEQTYYENWKSEAVLPMRSLLEACGLTLRAFVKGRTKRDGILAVVHNSDLRKAILDQRQLPQCLANNAVVLIASTQGVTMEPQIVEGPGGLRCYVFGIRRTPSGTSNSVQFLSKEEWRDIIEWAKNSKGAKSLATLKQLAQASVRRLLWPDDNERRWRMALVALCQGYLFCFSRHVAQLHWGEDVKTAVQKMDCEKFPKPPAKRWKTVQESEWWLRIYGEGEQNGALTKVERAKAVDRILELLNKGGKPSTETTRLVEMLEGGKVDDANVVVWVYNALQKELL
jgi:hypothetical protein